MDVVGKVIAITGAASGIGAAMAATFAAAGARVVIVSDRDGAGATAVAEEIDDAGGCAVAHQADVTSRAEVRGLVARARGDYGTLDILCSNAGVAFGAGVHAVEDQWARSWQTNVMQHVHAAQAALPGMLRAGAGHLLLTASAGGLLGVPGDAPYSVTKHATVGLGEWLAMTYRPHGIRVSVLCPLGVRTPLLMAGLVTGHPASTVIAAVAPILDPERVAQAALAGLRAESLLIFPHQEVAELLQRKAADPDAWLHETIETTATALRSRD